MRKFLFILTGALLITSSLRAQVNQPAIPNNLNPAFVGYGDSLQITNQSVLDYDGVFDQMLNMNLNLGKGFVLALSSQYSQFQESSIGLRDYFGQNLSFIKRIKVGNGKLGLGLQGTASGFRVAPNSNYESPLYRNLSAGANYERANYQIGIGFVGLFKEEWLRSANDSISAKNATGINTHFQTTWKYRKILIQPHGALALSHYNERLSYSWLNLGIGAKCYGIKAGINATHFGARLNTRVNVGYDWKHFSVQYFYNLSQFGSDMILNPLGRWTQGLTLRYHIHERQDNWRLF